MIFIIWLPQVLVAARGNFNLHCGVFMWDLVPQPGIEPGPPTLKAWSLSCWSTRKVSVCFTIKKSFSKYTYTIIICIYNTQYYSYIQDIHIYTHISHMCMWYMYIHIHIYMYTWMCMCVYIYIYIYIYIWIVLSTLKFPPKCLISSFITPKIILIIWFGFLRVMIPFLHHVTHLHRSKYIETIIYFIFT